MRVTVCELPHEARALAEAWARLSAHTTSHASELVLLPEFAMLEPVWESGRFDAARWDAVAAQSGVQAARLGELGARHVVGTRPVARLNQGYLWTAAGMQSLRSKYYLPEEPGSWEATWFERGDDEFPVYRAGAASFGLNICTELWALDTYASYAALGTDLVLSPRATSRATTGKWLAAGVVAAVRTGAFCLSSNRVDPTGACGGAGWIIDPDGEVLAKTSAAEPFVTLDIDLGRASNGKRTYPRYVFTS
ncbi:MAG: carbon-nitrogen hydrolase family protein [Gemmatimonadaceae bacterium]